MYRLSELLSGVNCRMTIQDVEEVLVTGVSSDSRCVRPGNVFVCIRGSNSDGADYIKEAIRRGARVIICDKLYDIKTKNAIFILSDDVRSAHAMVLSNLNNNPSRKMKVIAVTGTNGKTTVSRMIASALCKDGKRCAVIGTLGASFLGESISLSSMTTPDAELLYELLKQYADRGAEYVVMEASSHALALKKLDGIVFELGAITNMSAEHLDFHGNMDGYYEAKSTLFDKCKKGVFLCDDFYTVKMYNESKCEKVSCSVFDSKRDYFAENIGYSFENGAIFTLQGKNTALPLHCSIPAEFTVSNALLASTVLKELGVGDDSIYRGIADIRGIEGRMERVETESDFSVFIDFAHTPDALNKLLTSVRKIKRSDQRIVMLFGCGGDRDRSKRSLMGAVASHISDFVIITEDNSRSEESSDIIDEIMSGFDKSCPHVRIDDREKAIEYAVMNAGKGDIILLCGKGHENYEIKKDGKRYFCEKEIVQRAIKKRNGRKIL